MFSRRFMIVAVVAVFSSAAQAGSIRYVDDDAMLGGDGLSWDTAYKFPQDALNEAADDPSINEIRVAQGLYLTDRKEANPTGTGNREARFELLNGVAIMGGFAGVGAVDPDDRDINLYETILSGNIGFPHLAFDNSFHVTVGIGVDQTAVLDGVTITEGVADVGSGVDHTRRGGGMYNQSGSPTVSNCTFSGNFAESSGGGMYNHFGSSPAVTNCIFSANSAAVGAGGGMYNSNSSDPTLINCTFTANSAHTGGGGMVNSVSTPSVSGCVFELNQANHNGGAVENRKSDALFTDCIFSENSASDGGGMYNRGGSSPTITNCSFSGNTADNDGGGMYNFFSTAPTITDCTFGLNRAVSGNGGGMYNDQSSDPTVTNCTFAGNQSMTGEGGAIFNINSSLTLNNCILSGNVALLTGGGIYNLASFSTVTNCILWDNAPDQFYDLGFPTVSSSDVQGGWLGVGSNNIDADPLFVDADGPDDIIGTDDDDLRLLPGSPCIDAGDNTAVPVGTTIDLDGNPRFVDDPCTADTGIPDGANPIVDMGAYEFQGRSCDLDGDGSVGVTDLLTVLGAWGPCPSPCPSCPSDFDGDCLVGVTDLLILLGNWN